MKRQISNLKFILRLSPLEETQADQHQICLGAKKMLTKQ